MEVGRLTIKVHIHIDVTWGTVFKMLFMGRKGYVIARAIAEKISKEGSWDGN